ncbi:MAG: hypothetical protein ACKUBY_05915 [Candidatus Moraniibacteriota bacterium]
MLLHQGNLLQQVVHSRVKSVFIFFLEYAVILQMAIAIFGGSHWQHGSIVVFATIWFTLVLTWSTWSFIWPRLSDEKKESIRVLLRWVPVWAFALALLHNKGDVRSLQDAIILWHSIVNFSQKLAQDIFMATVVNVHKLVCKSIVPFGILVTITLPILCILHNLNAVFESMTQKARNILFFCGEVGVVTFAVKWVCYRLTISKAMFVIEVAAIMGTTIMWRIWSRLTVKVKRQICPVIWLCIILSIIILICQLVWDVHFFAAVTIVWRSIILKVLIFIKSKAILYTGYIISFTKLWWGRGITLITTLSWAQAKNFGVFAAQKVSARGAIKLGIALAITQFFANKKARALKNEKVMWAKLFFGKYKDRAVTHYKSLSFPRQMFWCIIGMTAIWLMGGSADFIYPLFPKGVLIKIFAGFRTVMGLFGAGLRKLGVNKVFEFISVILAKTFFGKMSLGGKHRMYMFRKWKIGRFVIGNNRLVMLINKDSRKEARRLRQISIDGGKLQALQATGQSVINASGKVLGSAVHVGMGMGMYAQRNIMTAISKMPWATIQKAEPMDEDQVVTL